MMGGPAPLADAPRWNPTTAELDLFEEWRGNTIQHLVNHKNGVPIHRLPAMLEERFDERIPIHNMGFPVWHINQFLYQMASDIDIRKGGKNGWLFVFLVESSVPKHLLHIRQMVLGQRDEKRATRKNSLRRVSCNELLRQGQRPPPQPANFSDTKKMATTFRRPGQSYNVRGGGTRTTSTNSNFGQRNQTNKTRSPNYKHGGPNSTMKKELVRSNSSAGVADPRKEEEDWDTPSTKICSSNPGTLKASYSRQPVWGTIKANVPMSRSFNSSDKFDGFELRSVSVTCTKENNQLPKPKTFALDNKYGQRKVSPPPSTSSRVVTVSEIQTSAPRPSASNQKPKENIKENELFSEAIIEELEGSVTNRTAVSTNNAGNNEDETSGFPFVATNDEMNVHYGYSIDNIDLDMGLPYSCNATKFGQTVPRMCRFKPKIRFPPYLTGDCKSFKDFLQKSGQLEKFMNSD